MLPVADVSRLEMTSSLMSPVAAASPAMAAGVASSARTVAQAVRADTPAVRTAPAAKEDTPAPTVPCAQTVLLVLMVVQPALTAGPAQTALHAGLKDVFTTPAAPTMAPARIMSAAVIPVGALWGHVEQRVAAVMPAEQMRHLAVQMDAEGTPVVLTPVLAELTAAVAMPAEQMRHLAVQMDAEETPAALTYLFVPSKDVAQMPVEVKLALLV